MAVTILSLVPFLASADLVHVVEQTEVGGVTNVVNDETKITGMPWVTATAPTVSGQIFTHWTISTKQEFAARDEWGRAYDAPCFMLYEDTTLTAHYLPVTQDEDGDGVADGYEIYWYGNLGQGAASDTDGDGWTFAQELTNGTNPLSPEQDVDGPIVYGDGDLLLYNPSNYVYNPSNYASAVIRSDPAGLFTSSEEWLRPGTYVATGSYSPTSSKFACWTRNGVVVRDEWGRAVDQIELMMGTNHEELVAILVDDANDRQKLYWYGTIDIALDSDTDGDGFTFAEEIANGTNPLTPENDVDGPITYADGELLQYNPKNIYPYTIKSDPEGALFETISDYATFGTFVDATTYSPNTSTFACWVLNGVEQRDEWGRTIEAMSLQMTTNAQVLVAKVIEDAEARQKYYWYGTTDVSMESDTDGDGFTFAEELANGTNPLTPETEIEGPIKYADSEELEVDLQPFEHLRGLFVGGKYYEIFAAEAGVTFGTNACPLALDVTGDGLFDLVVVSEGSLRGFANRGTVANPDFVEFCVTNGVWETFERLVSIMARPVVCGGEGAIYVSDDGGRVYRFGVEDGVITDTGLTGIPGVLDGRLIVLDAEGAFVCANAGMTVTLDTPVIDGLSVSCADSDADGWTDILVSDSDGHIWMYQNTSVDEDDQTFVLQHKVWAGSGVGFADGMTLSLVDWEEDGDTDVLIGTAAGKLMLLRDPETGRPTNVRATLDLPQVTLAWDPDVQSRVSGYNVYRSTDGTNFVRIAENIAATTLIDEPGTASNWWYRVTSVCRLYASGNSTPTVTESMPTEAVFVQMHPDVWMEDVSTFAGTNVEMAVYMETSVGIASEDWTMRFAYDPGMLTPVGAEAVAEAASLQLVQTVEGGTWTLRATGGEIHKGTGAFLRLVFAVTDNPGTDETTVSLNAATMRSVGGRDLELDLPQTGRVRIRTGEISVVAKGYDGIYDGQYHGIDVWVTDPKEGAVIRYALAEEGPYEEDLPTFRNVCSNVSVWYEISAERFQTLTNRATVTIAPKPLTEAMCVLSDDAWFYDGTEKKPDVTVVDGSPNLATKDDYTLDIAAKTEAGLFPVTITGTNNYTGVVVKEFRIMKRPVTPPIIPSYGYSGNKRVAKVPADARWTVVTNEGGTDVGAYEVVLRLTNTEDYRWRNLAEDQSDWTGVFVISRAVNRWRRTPGIESWTEGETPAEPKGQANFGTLSVAYRARGAAVESESGEKPTAAGQYTARFWVVGTANYHGLAENPPYKEVDFEIRAAAGSDPATTGTPVAVPHAWLESYAATYGGGDYEAAALATGANGRPLWESYVAGLDPEDETSEFTATITIDANGVPTVTWSPDLSEGNPSRTYTTLGKENLGDENWTPVTDENRSKMKFFTVRVELGE